MSLLDANKEYVYLLEEVGTNNVKIGKTVNDPNLRCNQLNTGNPRALKLKYAIETEIGKAGIEEKELHEIHKVRSTKSTLGGGSEWFDDTNGHVSRSFKHDERLAFDINKLYKNNIIEFYYEKLEEFSNKYFNIFEFVKKDIIPKLEKSDVVVLAPPKSGKRVMVESLALLMPFSHHVYIIALNRTDMQFQYEEFDKYKIINQCVTTTNKHKKNIENEIIELSKTGKVFVHFDELDYGSGNKGVVFKLIEKLKKNCHDVKYIAYSATPEEAIFSKGNYQLCHYRPDINYNGPKFFIENNLIKNAEMFFEYNEVINDIKLTNQACKIIQEWQFSDKNFIVLRLNYQIGKKSSFELAKKYLQDAIDNFVKNTNIDIEYINQDSVDNFGWFYKDDKGKLGTWWQHINKKTILVINSSCSRGTEVGFHPQIFAWHDYRKPGTPDKKANTTYATYAQAIGRVNHYSDQYENRIEFLSKNTKIKVYAEEDLFKIMNKIYNSNDKNEMLEIWKNYTNRKINSRTINSNKFNSNYKLSNCLAILSEKDINLIKKWLEKFDNIQSYGVSHANNQKHNICKDLIDYRPIKGRKICMVDNINNAKNTLNYSDFKNTEFNVMRFNGNILNYYYEQYKSTEILKINIEDLDNNYIQPPLEKVLGIHLLNETIHPLVEFIESQCDFITKNSVHNL